MGTRSMIGVGRDDEGYKASKWARTTEMGGRGLPAMTKVRQSALYSCATNDAPMRGAGVLLAARIRPVSQLRVRALARELGGTRETHVGVCCRLHSERTRIDVKSVPWVGRLSWKERRVENVDLGSGGGESTCSESDSEAIKVFNNKSHQRYLIQI